ncbi:MAG: LacI family DNA-binding transcriptional regulator [Anaerolineales bacterium]|nr:LacI family DNA-binding transcriptional regulator [Anaerolineales bacterium]
MTKKRVTSQDVANLAGVSRTTVSLVLNDVKGANIPEATRQRVFEAVKTLGYVPNEAARALVSQRSKAIGLVLTRDPSHIDTDAFLPRIITGLLEVVKKHNLRLLIESVNVDHQDQVYLQLARAKRIDGMILSTPRIDDTALRQLEDVGIPTVMMGLLSDSDLYSVDVNNRLAARKAVDYLLRLGHTKIACISNAPESYTASPDRVQGYRDALEAAGIEMDNDLICFGDFDPQSGYDRMKSLLALDKKFTAAFVASDNVAIGAKAALRAAGLKVPDDVSLIGFDDIPWAQYSDPPLTTIRLPAQELAKSSCLMLIDIMQGLEPVDKKLILETELVVRSSCRKLD